MIIVIIFSARRLRVQTINALLSIKQKLNKQSKGINYSTSEILALSDVLCTQRDFCVRCYETKNTFASLFYSRLGSKRNYIFYRYSRKLIRADRVQKCVDQCLKSNNINNKTQYVRTQFRTSSRIFAIRLCVVILASKTSRYLRRSCCFSNCTIIITSAIIVRKHLSLMQHDVHRTKYPRIEVFNFVTLNYNVNYIENANRGFYRRKNCVFPISRHAYIDIYLCDDNILASIPQNARNSREIFTTPLCEE